MSCKKNDGNPFGFSNNDDLSTKVKSSVSGFVTDENDLAVKQAAVQFGTASATTDQYGYFKITDVDVVKNAAVVTISKSGYFKGIKTYIAEEGKSAFFRIKLIRKIIAGNMNAASGGTVILSNGLSIAIPANAVVNATSNAAYTGTVNITAHWLNPTSNDLPNTMPGDLRGLNTAGNMQLLTTYGMAAVELTGSSGELLQIAPGKKATLTFPIPSSINANAPATIPLWYFDEATGLWKEEGSATKSGTNYVGEVSHFSFWNCDAPNTYVQFSCTVLNSSSQPISNAFVKISRINNPASSGYGYTNQNGYVAGAVPDNAQLLLEIFSSNTCTTPSYSQTFTTTNTNIALGNILVSPNTVVATISGTVTNCAGNAVASGDVILQIGSAYISYPLNSSGNYSFNILWCGNSNNITLIARDFTNSQQSLPASFPVTAGNNTIPNIQACGTSFQRFVIFTDNGITRAYTYPTDQISHILATIVLPPSVLCDRISAFETGQNTFVNINVAHMGIAQGSTQELVYFNTLWINDQLTILNGPIMVNITEYGSPGQYISGNFSGTFQGAPPNNTIHNISCSFRVLRTM